MLKTRGFIHLFPIIFVLAGLGGGTVTVVASQNSLPGDPLYSIKEISESVQVSITKEDKKAELYLKLAEKKLEEIQKLEEKGASIDRIAKANEGFQKYQRKASELAGNGQGGEAKSEEIIQKLEEGVKKQKDVLNKVLAKSSEETKEKVKETIATSEQEGKKLVEETKQKVESSTSTSTSTQSSPTTSYTYTSPTPTAAVSSPQTSPQVTPTPVSTNVGLRPIINSNTLNLSVGTGNSQALVFESTGATRYEWEGYPTSLGSDIYWTPVSGSISNGGRAGANIVVKDSVSEGTYSGTGVLKNPDNGQKTTFTVNITVSKKGALEVYAKDRTELPNNDLYGGIVRVKNPVSGAVVASGVTSSSGYLRLDGLTTGTYDVVLLKPSSYQSDICGDKKSVTFTAGQTERVYMSLRGTAVSGYTCVRD